VRRFAASIIAIVLAACACSSVTSGVGARAALAPGSASSSGNNSGPANQASLQSQLLTLHDMPSGWQVENPPDTSGSDAPPCLQNAGSNLPTRGATTAGFSAPDGLPVLFELLSQFGTSANVRSAYSEFQRVLNSCGSFDLPSGGISLHAALTPATLPAIGDQSTAWRLILTSDQSTAGSGAFLLARRGTELLVLLYVNLGDSDVQQILPFARAAIAKMPG
jgi:hypothetical protein